MAISFTTNKKDPKFFLCELLMFMQLMMFRHYSKINSLLENTVGII